MSVYEVHPPGWPTPKGYANGRVGAGKPLHVAGQIGWDEHGTFVDGGFVPQLAKALDNVIAIVKAAHGTVEDIASMTVYVKDIVEYRSSSKAIGSVWRERMGKHYPAMALVAITDFVEPAALVEIQAVAYIGEAP
jgi:enamine deaminase RidA (YjgF/YER057c/UK114 family)